MKKETLTVETNSKGTTTYRNASDQRHNPHGPAVVFADGRKWYYTNGKMLTEAEFEAWQAKQTAPLHNTTVTIGGVEYTLTAK